MRKKINIYYCLTINDLQLIIASKLLASALKIFIHAWLTSCTSVEDVICHQQKRKKLWGRGKIFTSSQRKIKIFSYRKETKMKLLSSWYQVNRWWCVLVSLKCINITIFLKPGIQCDTLYIITQTILAFWIGFDHNFLNPELWYDTLW